MGELNITFAGFCTSIYHMVPGVPMRTVLPDATAVRFGVLNIPDYPSEVAYFLMPHLAAVRTRASGGELTALTGLSLRVLNAKDQPLCRTDDGYRLTDFKKDLRLSSAVVFEGQALAYFDIFGGRVWTEGRPGEPRVTRVAIKTDGTPRIAMTALPWTLLPFESKTIESDELYLTNLDAESAAEDTHFDFLGNFLVAEGGIPLVLDKRTPGMPIEPKALTLEHLGERLKALGMLIETEGTVKGWRQAIRRGDEPGRDLPVDQVQSNGGGLLHRLVKRGLDPVPYNESCSPSQYP